MYLAKLQKSGKTHYEIRQSFQLENGSIQHHTVYELGEEPRNSYELYEDYIVLFSPKLIDALRLFTKKDPESLLENLLWEFLPPSSREKMYYFRNKDLKIGPLTPEERLQINKEVHLFDRRRLYYLRYGGVDQSRLTRLHEKCCRPLLSQSRDEREYYFAAEERALEPGMYMQYVYAIFNLQKHFSQSFAPWLPEALAQEEMDEYFLHELCRLNRDSNFWRQPASKDSTLHPHLIRYLVMYFDFRPRVRSFFDDFARSFMSDHRRFRWPEKKVNFPPEKIEDVFDTPYSELQKMNKEDLNKLYRKKAMKLHPDKGGDHELFIELTEIYNELLAGKKD